MKVARNTCHYLNPKTLFSRQTLLGKLMKKNKIPDEIFLSIFQNLEITDLQAASLVCKKFYQIASDNSLNKKERILFDQLNKLDFDDALQIVSGEGPIQKPISKMKFELILEEYKKIGNDIKEFSRFEHPCLCGFQDRSLRSIPPSQYCKEGLHGYFDKDLASGRLILEIWDRRKNNSILLMKKKFKVIYELRAISYLGFNLNCKNKRPIYIVFGLDLIASSVHYFLSPKIAKIAASAQISDLERSAPLPRRRKRFHFRNKEK